MKMPERYRLEACEAIIEAAEEARVLRAKQRVATDILWNGCAYTGVVRGALDTNTGAPSMSYPAIKLSLKVLRDEQGQVKKDEEGRYLFEPVRQYECNCWDHVKRSHIYGPCKHVIALAQAIVQEAQEGEDDQAA